MVKYYGKIISINSRKWIKSCAFLWEHTELSSVLGIIYNNCYDNIMNYLVTVNEQCMTQQEERSHEST